LTDDLSEHDRVTRYRRDEDLLAEVLLAVGEQRDNAERGGLPDRLGEHPGEHEDHQVESTRLAETRLQARAEDANEDEREREVRDDARAVAQQLDQVAMRQRQHARELSHSSASRSRDRRPRASGCAWARARAACRS